MSTEASVTVMQPKKQAEVNECLTEFLNLPIDETLINTTNYGFEKDPLLITPEIVEDILLNFGEK